MSGSTQPSTSRINNPSIGGATAIYAVHQAGEILRTIAFWGAILLPVAYLAVLHPGIIGQRVDVFLALLALHVACILIGHDGRQSPGSRATGGAQ